MHFLGYNATIPKLSFAAVLLATQQSRFGL
jgi:hypothetical protein